VDGGLVIDVLADDDDEEEEDDALLPMCEWGSAAEVLEAIRYTSIARQINQWDTSGFGEGALAGYCAI
jgi:hypothetical protein